MREHLALSIRSKTYSTGARMAKRTPINGYLGLEGLVLKQIYTLKL